MGKLARLVLVVALLVASSAFYTAVALAEAKKPTAVEGARFETSYPLKENLKIFLGKDVHLLLRSGQTLQGSIKKVGDHFVHLERIAGKDFYDALVRIDDVSAVEARFRELK